MIDAGVLLSTVLVLSLTAYALLGGADYGGGVWDLLASGPAAERQRATIAHAIGPVWEANQVWLIVAIVIAVHWLSARIRGDQHLSARAAAARPRRNRAPKVGLRVPRLRAG